MILARRTGKPISVFHIGLERAHTFKKSWDQFQIPYPFSRAVMFVAPPIRVPTDADSEVMKRKQAEMQAALERVRDVAESWFQAERSGTGRRARSGAGIAGNEPVFRSLRVARQDSHPLETSNRASRV